MEMESLLFSNWLRNIEVFLLLCLMPHLELCGVFVCLLFFLLSITSLSYISGMN